jgi:transcriptional regulator NrdR family protein
MCPHCGADNSKVDETRRHEGKVYRRRKCREFDCGKGFISVETAEEDTKFPAAITQAQLARLRGVGRQTAAPTNNAVFDVWR